MEVKRISLTSKENQIHNLLVKFVGTTWYHSHHRKVGNHITWHTKQKKQIFLTLFYYLISCITLYRVSCLEVFWYTIEKRKDKRQEDIGTVVEKRRRVTFKSSYNMYVMTPIAQQSTGFPYGFRTRTSGAAE